MDAGVYPVRKMVGRDADKAGYSGKQVSSAVGNNKTIKSTEMCCFVKAQRDKKIIMKLNVRLIRDSTDRRDTPESIKSKSKS